MLKAVAAALALTLLAPAPAGACVLPSSQYGIVFDRAPMHLEADGVLILEVQFEGAYRIGRGEIGRARVINVVSGYYGWDTIEVSLNGDSCRTQPSRGERGFVAGILRELPNRDLIFLPYGAPSMRERMAGE